MKRLLKLFYMELKYNVFTKLSFYTALFCILCHTWTMFINGCTDIIVGTNVIFPIKQDVVFLHIEQLDLSIFSWSFSFTICTTLLRILTSPIVSWMPTLRRFLILCSFIAMLRSFSVIVTIFPNPLLNATLH